MKRILIILLLVFALVGGLFARGQQEAVSIMPGSGRIVYLEGEVTLNGTSAEIGNSVEQSDVVTTGFDSYCEIIFANKNIFRLDAETIAKIKWENSSIELTKGGFGAVFNKLDNFAARNNEFNIETPSAVAGVRGTVFYIKVEDENNTYFCICNGELSLEQNAEELNVAAMYHKAYRFTRSDSGTAYTNAGLLYHDDPKMESLAAKIDYVIPWDKSGSSAGY